MAASKVLGKGQATTATGTPPPVTVQAQAAVTVKFRLFAAEQTAKLDHSLRGSGPSSGLNGLALILGTVEGGVFKPFEDKIRTAPIPVTGTGELSKGTFRALSGTELAEMKKADAKRKDKSLKAEERKKAESDFETKFGHVATVTMHVIPLPKRIEPGTTVAMCINMDAKKKFRKYPLWQTTISSHDTVIDVFETYGHRGLNDKVGAADTRNEGTAEKPLLVDYYPAELSGNTWMRSTHPFTEADVDALAETTATAALKAALKKIYAADFIAVGGDFAIDATREADQPKPRSIRLLWKAGENSNCTSNIQNVDIKRDIPCRIHPGAYAAVINAALDAELTEVRISSSWRPMLGSIGHRSGRGLDIVYLVSGSDATRLNRAGLTSQNTTDKNHDGIVDGTSISIEEQEAFNAWKKAEMEQKAAVAANDHAKALLDNAMRALAAAKKSGNADAIEKAEHARVQAQKTADEANTTAKAAEENVPAKKTEWSDQVKKHQPGKVGMFRRGLMKAEVVTQIIDPWYVDLNTKDKKDGVVNEQKKDGLQNIHNNHLHITIYDAELHG